MLWPHLFGSTPDYPLSVEGSLPTGMVNPPLQISYAYEMHICIERECLIMQSVAVIEDGAVRVIPLAAPDTEVVPGVKWGEPGDLLTPAYWAIRTLLREDALVEVAEPAASLVEEVTFCLLGGFGVTAELADAFFRHLRHNSVFSDAGRATEAHLLYLLSERIPVGESFSKYRYPNQRAARLSEVIPALKDPRFSTDDPRLLRQELLTLDGIGPKTASWIVRNWLKTNDVAIIDIHIIRACQIMGLFPASIRLPGDYDDLECRFLELARGLDVAASALDAVIWSEMREFSPRILSGLT